MSDLPNPTYSARDYTSMRSELVDFISRTRPDLWNDYNDGGLGALLVSLLALSGDMTNYTLDSNGQEVFFSTAQRYESLLRWCHSVGYTPRVATAAQVSVTCNSLPQGLVSTGGSIPEGTLLTTSAGYTFEFISGVSISPGASTITTTLYQGRTYTEAFSATGQTRLELTTAHGNVAASGWEVYVGQVIPANKWTQVDNVALELSATQTYEVEFDGDSKLTVRFGDGEAGAVPTDTITIKYRVCDGEAPNETLVWGYADAVAGAETYRLVFEGDAKVAGGADRESPAELRVNVPAFMRSLDKPTTLTEYAQTALAVPGISLAASDVWFSQLSGNALKLYIWGSETVTFVYDGVSAQRASATYHRYCQATEMQATAVQTYLKSRTPVGTFVAILRPLLSYVDLYIRELRYDAAYDKYAVAKNILAATVELFESGTGFAMKLAEIYAAIRAVPGVLYFNLDRVVITHPSGTYASGTIHVGYMNIAPTVNSTIRINDGVDTVTFQFTTATPSPGNVAVDPGGLASTAAANLAIAIAANLSVTVTVTGESANPTVQVVQTNYGPQYNIAMVATGTYLSASGMTGGAATTTDYRRDPNVSTTNDPWPPAVGYTYTPGYPFIASGSWIDVGVTPYQPLADIAVTLPGSRYYDEVQMYNNELIFDPDPNGDSAVGALVLRRLVVGFKSNLE